MPLFAHITASKTSVAVNNPCSIQERAGCLITRTKDVWSAYAIPIFYRSKLFPAISHTSPSILLDVFGREGEQSIFFSLYQLTYRCNPLSSWLDTMTNVLAGLASVEKPQVDSSSDRNCDIASSLTRVRLVRNSFVFFSCFYSYLFVFGLTHKVVRVLCRLQC